MDKMHQTPGIPGTEPVTDNPNPGGTQGMNPQGPSTGTEGYGLGGGEREAAGRSVAVKTFRCADAGNADCRWEATGRTEDELRAQIERHGREEHGITDFGRIWSRVKDAIRERAA
jgi:predicted small metal-binding protein